MPSGDPAVVAENLTKRFGAFTAVDRINLSITKGEVVAFVGPNGAGKSTTIRMLCGLLRPSAGRAEVAGLDVQRQPEGVRAHIGYMSQKFSLYPDLTVAENLGFFGGLYQVPHSQAGERIRQAIKMAGLEGREDALVGTLAGGWRQRLALGCAILHRPPVLFLDEPTSGVEPQARRRFWDLINDLASQGVTILVSTHYMDEAEYCNRVALIDEGRLLALGSPSSLRSSDLGGDLFELDCTTPSAALAELRPMPGVIEAAVFGDKLHILLQRSAIDPGGLMSALKPAGIETGMPRPITPSLEDVFVRVVSRARSQEDHP
jgi:ABC-2 type transport system ATP-binding protein